MDWSERDTHCSRSLTSNLIPFFLFCCGTNLLIVSFVFDDDLFSFLFLYLLLLFALFDTIALELRALKWRRRKVSKCSDSSTPYAALTTQQKMGLSFSDDDDNDKQSEWERRDEIVIVVIVRTVAAAVAVLRSCQKQQQQERKKEYIRERIGHIHATTSFHRE